MSATALMYSHRFLEHDTGPHHPERPERLRAIHERLQKRGILARTVGIDARPVDLQLLARVHAPEYIARLREACEQRARAIDTPDCPICPRSYEIALLAAGGMVAAVDAVLAGQARNAFCLVRPPGHHAEHDSAMGFCFFNNIAIAAERARSAPGVQRVFILDWDVHHGNGTQHHFESDPDVFFCSIHQHPATLFPGTGYAAERGTGEGEGFTLNVPMAPGCGDDEYRAAFEDQILPAMKAFRPEFILISVGFDAHGADPLANICLTVETFAWMTRKTMEVARACCDGHIVSVLEGGYNLEALAACSEAHVECLMNEP